MLSNEVFSLERRAYYDSIGLIVDHTNGEFAHSPLTKKECDTGYYLLHDDHQHQGLLQSRDLDKCCFFPAHVKDWLERCDSFPSNFFELWDIYEKYASALGKENAERLHCQKDEEGKSVVAKRMGLKSNLNEEKDERGRSINAVKGALVANSKKNEKGKSFGSTKGAEALNSQVWESTVDGFRSTAGNVARHNIRKGWDPKSRVRVA